MKSWSWKPLRWKIGCTQPEPWFIFHQSSLVWQFGLTLVNRVPSDAADVFLLFHLYRLNKFILVWGVDASNSEHELLLLHFRSCSMTCWELWVIYAVSAPPSCSSVSADHKLSVSLLFCKQKSCVTLQSHEMRRTKRFNSNVMSLKGTSLPSGTAPKLISKHVSSNCDPY